MLRGHGNLHKTKDLYGILHSIVFYIKRRKNIKLCCIMTLTGPIFFKIKDNSNRFGIRALELTIKVQDTSIFIKRIIYEEVQSILSRYL